MNRQQRRASEANGRQMMAGGWNRFEDITAEALVSPAFQAMTTVRPVQVWKNNLYIVQRWAAVDTWMGPLEKLGCRRNDGSVVRAWADLQRIKTELLGPERVAMEFFPAESKLTDVANMYWLWALPADIFSPVSLGK